MCKGLSRAMHYNFFYATTHLLKYELNIMGFTKRVLDISDAHFVYWWQGKSLHVKWVLAEFPLTVIPIPIMHCDMIEVLPTHRKQLDGINALIAFGGLQILSTFSIAKFIMTLMKHCTR